MMQFLTIFFFASCFPLIALGAIEHEEYFHNAAYEMQVPVDVVKAISRVESRGMPYLLTISGKRYMCDTKTEALIIAKKAQREGKSFDVGMMQVNNKLLSVYGIPLDAALDPAANILLGAYILREAIKYTGGDLWAGVGYYDSPTPERAVKYVEKVRRRLSLMDGSVDTLATMYNTDWWDDYHRRRQTLADTSQAVLDADDEPDKPISLVSEAPVYGYGKSKRGGGVKKRQIDTNGKRSSVYGSVSARPSYPAAGLRRQAPRSAAYPLKARATKAASVRPAAAAAAPVSPNVVDSVRRQASLVVYRGTVERQQKPVHPAVIAKTNPFVQRR